MPITAVRSTLSGIAALEAYLNDEVVTVRGSRKWNPSEMEVALLVAAPVPHQWVTWFTMYERVREACGETKNVLECINKLSDDGLYERFREIDDATYIRCTVGQFTFNIQWTVFRKQLNDHTKLAKIVRDLKDNAVAIVDSNPPLSVILA